MRATRPGPPGRGAGPSALPAGGQGPLGVGSTKVLVRGRGLGGHLGPPGQGQGRGGDRWGRCP